jgi:hypothetical protein
MNRLQVRTACQSSGALIWSIALVFLMNATYSGGQTSAPICGNEWTSCNSEDTRREPWTNGVIYFEWDGGLLMWDLHVAKNIRDAMTDWEEATGDVISFSRSTTHEPRVIIMQDACCSSSLGMPRTADSNGAKIATIHLKDVSLEKARHELGHLIGLDHTHQRTDRDRFLILNRQWLDIGGTLQGSPAAATAASGRAHVVVNIDDNGNPGLWHRYWDSQPVTYDP